MRGLAEGSDGRLYVGATADFGVLEADEKGLLLYRSLSERLDDVPGEVFDLKAYADGVFFLTRAVIYFWDGQDLATVREGQGFYSMYHVGDDLLLLISGSGLHRWIRGATCRTSSSSTTRA